MKRLFSAELWRDRNSELLEAVGPFCLTGHFFSQELMLGSAEIWASFIPDQGRAWMLTGLMQDQNQAQIRLLLSRIRIRLGYAVSDAGRPSSGEGLWPAEAAWRASDPEAAVPPGSLA